MYLQNRLYVKHIGRQSDVAAEIWCFANNELRHAVLIWCFANNELRHAAQIWCFANNELRLG